MKDPTPEKSSEAREPRPEDVQLHIEQGNKQELLELIDAPGVVEMFSPEQEAALAQHNSVEIPRALARHGDKLDEQTQRILAKSRIFTARRELVKSAGLLLPPDVLDELAKDDDAAVRNLVAKLHGDSAVDNTRPSKSTKRTGSASAPRKHAGDGFANQPRAALLQLLETDKIVSTLTAQQQVDLAKHRSVEVPRALARHAAILEPEAQLALAESRIFTARRELVRRAGADLPTDVLGLLIEDDDSVVRALVSSVWNPSDDELPESVRARRAEIAKQVAKIRRAKKIKSEELDELLRKRDERLLVEVASNPSIVESLTPEYQLELARSRSIAVPRALATQAQSLSPNALAELAQSPVFTARRALVRHGMDRLSDELLQLLRADEDAVVRKLVADLSEREPLAAAITQLDPAALTDLAEAGDIQALSQLGLLAWNADDIKAARAWFEQAAALGDSISMLDLETLALEAGDALSAEHWLRKAADAGHPSAIFRVEQEVVEDPNYDGMNLSGLSFAGQDLSRASFRGADLQNADFTNAILTRAIFCGANATSADFTGATLNAATFGPYVRDPYNPQADTWTTDDVLVHARKMAEFESKPGATLIGAVFNGANAARANFENANLTGADFTNASVRDADFLNAVLDDVVADDADTEGSFYFVTDWDLSLSSGDFTNRWLPGRDFTDVDVTGGDFRSAQLAGSTFDGLNLTKADFTNANLIGASFVGATLTNALFAGAILVAADFTEATLTKADLSKAVLTVSELRELNREKDERDARAMLTALDRLTGGSSEDDEVDADEVENHLSDMDKYAGVKDANLSSANIDEAKMPDWWKHDH